MLLVLSAALSKESEEGWFYLLMCLAEADKWRLKQSMSYFGSKVSGLSVIIEICVALPVPTSFFFHLLSISLTIFYLFFIC